MIAEKFWDGENILLEFEQKNVLKLIDLWHQKIIHYLQMVRIVENIKLTTDALTCFICQTLNFIFISIEPFIMSSSFFFGAINCKFWSPVYKGSCDAINVLKLFLNSNLMQGFWNVHQCNLLYKCWLCQSQLYFRVQLRSCNLFRRVYYICQ